MSDTAPPNGAIWMGLASPVSTGPITVAPPAVVSKLVAIDAECSAGITSTFASIYGAAAGQTQDQFFATADQALFVANNGTIRGWLPVLANRLAGMDDPAKAAEGTVRNYLSSAIAKIGARNRIEAAATARERGWL